MKCRKVAQELPAYLANELPEGTRDRVERHLKHCVPCRSELRALKRTDQLLDTLGEIEPRRDLVGLVMRRIEREQETLPVFKRFLISVRERRSQVVYAAANVLAVLLLAFGLYQYQVRRAARNEARFIRGPGAPRRPVPAEVATVERPAVREPRVVPLNDGLVNKLNRDMAAAREALGKHRALDGTDSPLILSPGDDGSLVIEVGSRGATEPAE